MKYPTKDPVNGATRLSPGTIPMNGKCPWCNHKYAGELMRQHAERVHRKYI